MGEAQNPGPGSQRRFGGSVMTTSEDALIRDGESLEVPSQPTEPRTRRLVLVSSTQVDPVPQRRTVSGPRRRRRRIQWEGSDSRPPTVAGGPIHHDLTLIHSSDEDAPFTVPRAAFPARPSRRVVLVPGSVEATPQSIQDRGGVETLNTQSDIFSCAGAREGARVAAVPESFGRWSTIPASRSAFHARSVELPQRESPTLDGLLCWARTRTVMKRRASGLCRTWDPTTPGAKGGRVTKPSPLQRQ